MGGHPWSLNFFIYIIPGVKQEQRHFLGMSPRSLLAPALRCSHLGVSLLTARVWENHTPVVGSSGAGAGGHGVGW